MIWKENIWDWIYCRKTEAIWSNSASFPSEQEPPNCKYLCLPANLLFSASVADLFRKGLQPPSWIQCYLHNVFKSFPLLVRYSSLGTEESRREPDLMSKAGGELQGRCAWPLRDAHDALSRCRSQLPRTTCKAVSGELHLEGFAEPFCRRSDTCDGLGEEIIDAPIPPIRRKQLAFSLFFTANSAL